METVGFWVGVGVSFRGGLGLGLRLICVYTPMLEPGGPSSMYACWIMVWLTQNTFTHDVSNCGQDETKLDEWSVFTYLDVRCWRPKQHVCVLDHRMVDVEKEGEPFLLGQHVDARRLERRRRILGCKRRKCVCIYI